MLGELPTGFLSPPQKPLSQSFPVWDDKRKGRPTTACLGVIHTGSAVLIPMSPDCAKRSPDAGFHVRVKCVLLASA